MDITALLATHSTTSRTSTTGQNNSGQGPGFAAVLRDAGRHPDSGLPKGLTLLSAPAPKTPARPETTPTLAHWRAADLLAPTPGPTPAGSDQTGSDQISAEQETDDQAATATASGDIAVPPLGGPTTAPLDTATAATGTPTTATGATPLPPGTLASEALASAAAPRARAEAAGHNAEASKARQRVTTTHQGPLSWQALAATAAAQATSGQTGASIPPAPALPIQFAGDATPMMVPAQGDSAGTLLAGTGTGTAFTLTTATPSSATVLAPPSPIQALIQAPVGSAPWQQQLAQQMMRFAQQGEQRIQLHLHPRELGPLQISLRVDDNGAQAHFFSSHGQVRDAVQQAIPQLREALAGQGIALGEAMVGQQQQQQQQTFGDAPSPLPASSVNDRPADTRPAHASGSSGTPTPNGNVDTWA